MFELIPELLVVMVGLGGIVLAAYIRRKKMHPAEAMVCPLGSDCRSVIHSEYSSFFGVPLEVGGMLYYSIVTLTYVLYVILPLSSALLAPFIFPLTIGAVLFSAYLTFIQAFTLREWCTWCLLSAALSTVIFLLALGTTDFAAITAFLRGISPVLITLHFLGLAIGLGAATFSDVFFFKFLRDFKMSEHESDTLRTVSQIAWFGLGLLILSGAGIYLTDPALYLSSARFLVATLITLIIILNGAFLNLYVTPRLVHISFGESHEHFSGELKHERGLAYISATVSVVSWYTVLVLEVLDQSLVPYWVLLLAYFTALAVGVYISLRVEQHLTP